MLDLCPENPGPSGSLAQGLRWRGLLCDVGGFEKVQSANTRMAGLQYSDAPTITNI